MASNEDHSPSPDPMETDEGENVSDGERPHSAERNPHSSYSSMTPREDSQDDASGLCRAGDYSPTCPTGDGDDLEAIFGSQTSEHENSLEHESYGNADDAGTTSVQDMDREHGALDHDSDTCNSSAVQEKGGDESTAAAIEEEEEKKAEENAIPQGLLDSQGPGGWFDISETFLDNMNPQDDSQDPAGGEEEESAEQMSIMQDENVNMEEQNSACMNLQEQVHEEDKMETFSNVQKNESFQNMQEDEENFPDQQKDSEVSALQGQQTVSDPACDRDEGLNPEGQLDLTAAQGDEAGFDATGVEPQSATEACQEREKNDSCVQLESGEVSDQALTNVVGEKPSQNQSETVGSEHSLQCQSESDCALQNVAVEQSPQYQSDNQEELQNLAYEHSVQCPLSQAAGEDLLEESAGVIVSVKDNCVDENLSTHQDCIDRDSSPKEGEAANSINMESGADFCDSVSANSMQTSTDNAGEEDPQAAEEGDKTAADASCKSQQAVDHESEDDVQIIEGPPQEPIDTLIVDDDEDDDRADETKDEQGVFKQKRTVEQDGNDLRIVIREEEAEKDVSDKRRRRHERDRREERRSDSHRRSDSDRRSSDRSSRRRHHRSRSRSRERRRKRSRSSSRSRERSSRRRRHRSRDKSSERERSSHRKRRRDRSRERRHRSKSRSHSPRRHGDDSWDKENKEDNSDEPSKDSSSNRKRPNYRHEKTEDSSEDERSEKKDDSPEVKSNSQQHIGTWNPGDNFQKDPPETPASGHSPGVRNEDRREEIHADTAVPALNQGREEQKCPVKWDEILPENIPIPENIPVPLPVNIPPPPFFIPVLGMAPAPLPDLHMEVPLPPPVPEEAPQNPPEPPATPPPLVRRPDGLPPPKGEGLLPTPIRRKAALEESARKLAMEEAAYDPAHPTEEEADRLMFTGGPGAPVPHPEMLGAPPRLPGQLLSDGTFVVPAPGEGGLLGPPPQRVPLSSMSFSPHRPLLVNHVLLSRPPFTNGPFSAPLPGSPMTRFQLQVGGPGGLIQVPGQYGQHLPPPGPPPPPQAFPTSLGERFEEGPPPPIRQFPATLPSGLPDMKEGLPPPLTQFPVSLPSGFPEMKEGHPSALRQFPVSLPSGLPEIKEGFPPFPMSIPAGLAEMKEPPPIGQFPVSLPSRVVDLKEPPPPLGQFAVSAPSVLPEMKDPPPLGQLKTSLPDMKEPPPAGQFHVSLPSQLPKSPAMGPLPGLPLPSVHLLSQPPPDLPKREGGIEENKFEKTLANLVVAQNLLSVIKDGKQVVDGGGETESVAAPPSLFKVPLPPVPATKTPSARIKPTEDSTEVMDMDMSPLDEDCELELPPPDAVDESMDKSNHSNSKPLTAIDIKALSNAIKKLTQPVDDVPASSAELTNKEKYMKKLHLQERVEDEVKQAIRPFYSNKKITKEEYKEILRKAVPKVCHSKSGDINPLKIQQLVEGYVNKFQKARQQIWKKPEPAPKDNAKVNGEHAKASR